MDMTSHKGTFRESCMQRDLVAMTSHKGMLWNVVIMEFVTHVV